MPGLPADGIVLFRPERGLSLDFSGCAGPAKSYQGPETQTR